MTYTHTTVLLHEAVDLLDCTIGKTYADGTLGGAGHSALICSRIAPTGRLLCTDNDPAALENARARLKPWLDEGVVKLFNRNYDELGEILEEEGIAGLDGILLDLGLSFNQIANSGRGFSFSKSEPLDMRMNPHKGLTAARVVNTFKEAELADIFWKFGEERFSRQIAWRIVQERQRKPIETSQELADMVSAVIHAKSRSKEKIHPATRVFMALRIFVNAELEHLESFLSRAGDWLNHGGRLAIISFHSLEDRMVKHTFREMATGCICPKSVPLCVCGRTPQFKVLTRKAIRPGKEELEQNPMARSAFLRGLEKL